MFEKARYFNRLILLLVLWVLVLGITPGFCGKSKYGAILKLEAPDSLTLKDTTIIRLRIKNHGARDTLMVTSFCSFKLELLTMENKPFRPFKITLPMGRHITLNFKLINVSCGRPARLAFCVNGVPVDFKKDAVSVSTVFRICSG